MSDDLRGEVTRILHEVDKRPAAIEELLPLVYEQLKAIARNRMAAERGSHTLQPTALVHEAYVRLLGDGEQRWQGRRQFYAASAEAMRRILIDHARRKRSVKRGGGKMPIQLDRIDLVADEQPEQFLALDEALTRLEDEDSRAASVVRLRFYAGLGVDAIAEQLEISRRTVMREWSFAKTRLLELFRTVQDE